MRRWLALGVGMGIAATAFYTLLTLDPTPPAAGEVDDASRAKLERLLRESAREPMRR